MIPRRVNFNCGVWKLSNLLTLTFLLNLFAFSQPDKKPQANSPVFKSYKPPTATPRIEHSDATYQMWEGFRVLQQANAGDVVSQFEVSIRYLTGRGFKADTARAAYWTKRAAEKNHLLARFNLGIFQFNGWGTDWNPFESYRSFRFAAERNIPEAQYALAQFLTENLVVPANWNEAFRWVKLAADSGYAPAKAILTEFERRGYRSDSSAAGHADGAPEASTPGAIQLLFINFSTDTIKASPDSVLVDDLFKAAALTENAALRAVAESLVVENGIVKTDAVSFRQLMSFAEAGSPEALTLVARCHEKGFQTEKDTLAAATYHVRAIRLDSRRSPRLLYSLLQEKNFFPVLRVKVNEGNAHAQYVWSCLIALGFDRQLTDAQALQMLERAAAANHPQALVELGLCYYTGRWVKRNEGQAKTQWQKAVAAGSAEARVRLAVAKLRGRDRDYAYAMPALRDAARDGSALAEFALGYCFETGSGVPKRMEEAARLYRSSAQRGSQDAMRALRRLHDSLRPRDKQFQLAD
jgi:hypothetical protein